MSVSRRAFALGVGALPLLKVKATRQAGDSSQQEDRSAPAPQLFDPHELATVAAIAEIIIPATDTPGARDAQVAEYLDLILSDSLETVRTNFREGLWWVDGYSQRSSGAPFKELPTVEQVKIVARLHDSTDDTENTGRQFVHSMKVWTARIYYSTQIGQRELNKGGRVPAHYFGHCV